MIAKVSSIAFFANDPPASHAEFTNDAFTITRKGNKNNLSIKGSEIKQVKTSSQLMHTKLTVTTHSGRQLFVGGLNKKDSKTLESLIARSIKKHEDAARQLAPKLSKSILKAEKEAKRLLSQPRYLRHATTSAAIQTTLTSATANPGPAERFISPKAKESLAHIRRLMSPEGLEAERKKINESFVTKLTTEVKKATKDIAKHGLTSEQTKAVATDEEATLVLAGAGTGKTVVITAKIAHLVRNQGIPPEKILVLAFNGHAAREIQKRLPQDLKAVTVLTFHAFGRHVIATLLDRAPTISKMASDDFTLPKAMDDILEELINEPEVGGAAINFILNMPGEYKAPFDFKNEHEYQKYIKKGNLRALSGDLVKSFEELEIANWLTQNGVPFKYERTYPRETATREHRQYEPDFWISDHDIYIEHFALNAQGFAPPHWTDYEKGVDWKRQIHLNNQTTLIETYSWQHQQNILLPILQQKLEEAGVQFHPIPRRELIAQLGRQRISPLCSLLCAFLNHAKSGNVAHHDLLQRAQTTRDKRRAETFLKVFTVARKKYEERLAKEKAIDFHDLINQATKLLQESTGGNAYTYTHVLVDEFQDISIGRMQLLKSLKTPETAYFLVGDDWQSIYRFTGSTVNLLHNVPQHLGYTQIETLSQTFRFGNKVLEPSSHFIQQNPDQTRRTLQPNPHVNDKGITLVASSNEDRGLRAVIKDLRKSSDYEQKDSIMVLGRYNESETALKAQGPTAQRKIIFSTVHRAKGQEEDYVIILGLRDDTFGFPCRREDDPLLTLVMSPEGDNECEHAEERRLFYVALTRARKGVYLVADENRPSPFVTELLKTYEKEIRQISKPIFPCPRCEDGTLRESKTKNNLRCSNQPECGYLSPRCPDCKIGFISIREEEKPYCSNQDCDTTQDVCPSCRQGILVRRIKQRDRTPFIGCSRFPEEPPCRYTRNIILFS